MRAKKSVCNLVAGQIPAQKVMNYFEIIRLLEKIFFHSSKDNAVIVMHIAAEKVSTYRAFNQENAK